MGLQCSVMVCMIDTSAQIFQKSRSCVKGLGTRSCDIKKGQYCGPTSIKCHYTKFSHTGNLAQGVFAPLIIDIYEVDVRILVNLTLLCI
jgi:hypothetical protein